MHGLRYSIVTYLSHDLGYSTVCYLLYSVQKSLLNELFEPVSVHGSVSASSSLLFRTGAPQRIKYGVSHIVLASYLPNESTEVRNPRCDAILIKQTYSH